MNRWNSTFKVKPKKRKTIKSFVPKRSTLKNQIVRLLGLLDRKKNGNACRIHCKWVSPGEPGEVLAYFKVHPGTCAYHIVPAQRGDSIRFVPENVVWACQGANYGEHLHRSLYRQKHIEIFGKDLIERLENQAREIVKFSNRQLLEMRKSIQDQLAAR